MNSAYNFNLYIKGRFSGFHECPLCTGLTVSFYADAAGILLHVNGRFTIGKLKTSLSSKMKCNIYPLVFERQTW